MQISERGYPEIALDIIFHVFVDTGFVYIKHVEQIGIKWKSFQLCKFYYNSFLVLVLTCPEIINDYKYLRLQIKINETWSNCQS